MALLNLEDHLVFYRSYHFNKTNVTIHLICIPIILLSAIGALTCWQFAEQSIYINLGIALAVGYGLFYSLLDWKLGIPALMFLASSSCLFTSYYSSIKEDSLISRKGILYLYLALHFGGWIAQLYGHKIHEQRAPAFTDNVLQALVLAPFFVVFEIAFWAGYRPDLKKHMDSRAGKNVLEFRKIHPKSI